MKMSRQWGIPLALFLAASPAAALAADSMLTLVVGGEAYDGPPKFEVMFDGKLLGEGSVAAAIDTASAGRFADASDKTPYVQSFTFAVPEAAFNPDGEVRLKFINEAYGGDGSNRDRNLYLASVTLNGRVVTVSGLSTETSMGTGPRSLVGEFLEIPDGSIDAVSKPPMGGWPQPQDPVVTGNIAPKLAGEPAVEPMRTAALDPNPEAQAGQCDLDEVYNVIGFNENSNELTPKLIDRLDKIAAAIGNQRCKAQVTGYSSRRGGMASNALFSVERAQNTLDYLKEHGVKFAEARATGFGETDQFGPDFDSNRRVVIKVMP